MTLTPANSADSSSLLTRRETKEVEADTSPLRVPKRNVQGVLSKHNSSARERVQNDDEEQVSNAARMRRRESSVYTLTIGINAAKECESLAQLVSSEAFDLLPPRD